VGLIDSDLTDKNFDRIIQTYSGIGLVVVDPAWRTPMPPAVMLSIVTLFILGVAVTAMNLGRIIQAWMIHRSLRAAIATDRKLAEDLAAKLDIVGQRADPRSDDRAGLVLVAIGLATAGYGLIVDDTSLRQLLGAALFPLLVGAALLLRHAMHNRAAAKKHVGGD
jgi:hypothetical protein